MTKFEQKSFGIGAPSKNYLDNYDSVFSTGKCAFEEWQQKWNEMSPEEQKLNCRPLIVCPCQRCQEID